MRDLEVVRKAGHSSEMPSFAIALPGKAGLKPRSGAVCGDDQSLPKYFTPWAFNVSGGGVLTGSMSRFSTVFKSPASHVGVHCVCSLHFNPAISGAS